MKKREITNNELEQLFGTIIKQAPLIAEDQVNSMLVGLPATNQGSALKRFFQNRLNTILLVSALVVITSSIAWFWIISSETTESSIVENSPQPATTAPVSKDTLEIENIVIEKNPEIETIEETKSVLPEKEVQVEVAPVSEPEPKPKPKPLHNDTLTLEKLYKQLDKKPQIFSVRTDKDTLITCKEGTTLKIKANSFISEETGQPITGNIEVAVKEYYKISDIVLANLTTISGNRMLESGGMLHIAATANNEYCVIKPGKTIVIGFPYENKKEDMNLFYGEQTDNGMEWELAQMDDDVAIQEELVIEVSPVTIIEEEEAAEEVFYIVEQMPSFPGGEKALKKYIQERAIYPFSMLNDSVSGKVYVRLEVRKDGSIGDIYVTKGINETLDKLAAYIVSNMPKWKPGKLRRKAVNVTHTIPVTFVEGERILSDEEIEQAKKLDTILDTFKFDLINNSYHGKLMEFEEKVKDNNFEETNIAEVRQYLFNTTRLGWINCDRFYKYSKPAVDFYIRTENADKIIVNAIFNEFKGMLQGRYQDGKIHFDRIPEGEMMTFVVIKTLNNQIYLAVKKTVVAENGEMELDFQPVTLELLKKEMEKLNELF